jgi:hypothetical protein
MSRLRKGKEDGHSQQPGGGCLERGKVRCTLAECKLISMEEK